MSCLSVVRTDVAGHKGLYKVDTTPSGYGPSDLQSAYNLPSSTAGSGATVAVVDAYDDPTAEADLAIYRSQYGLPPCTTANGCFSKVAQDGSTNYPPPDPEAQWEIEESLDVDMVSAICPNCHILLVESNDNSTDNLGTAVNEAVTLGAKYVSNSYGGSEDPSETTDDTQYYQHAGVAVTASSGDGSYGVEYPAASQYVTAVGGTTLTQDSSVPRGWTETAWAGAGSGCSAYEAKPTWQTDSGCSNRTVADVSADADPNTGVAFYDSYESSGWGVVGGTSVASPIIASTFALAGTPVAGTYPSSYPYADASALNDVTSGSNGTCTPAYLCTAGPGYDGPTGLGTPNGVTAFTTGPHGVVSGTVTDASSGDPLSGAEVDVGTDSTITNSSGDYSIRVPVGSYSVAAKDFGYATKTDSGVQVTNGQTTTENFALATAPSVTLTGTVTDGSGQGWPLYANVTVPGTPASTYTNPATGQYKLTLPDNATYNVNVDPVYPGYQQSQKSVKIAKTSLSKNFSVLVDATSCSALGYHLKYTGSTQTFDGTTAPAGWTVVNNNGQPGWDFNNPADLANDTGGTGNFANVDSDYLGDDTQDTDLVSPVINMSKDTTPAVQFNSDLFGWFNSASEVDVSTNGGKTWTSVWQNSGYPGILGPDLETVPLPTAVGKSDVQVRFAYTGNDSEYWSVDNVFLGNRGCVPTTGGLVEGNVTDGNTGGGVNGGTVTSVSNPSQTGVTSPTPADPNLGDGFYYLFSPATGSQQFTAAAANYVTASASVDVTSASTSTANFTLQAGQLSVTPGSLSTTERMGQTNSQPLKFSDTGKAPVTVKLYEQPGTFTILGQRGSVPVQRVNGTFSPLSAISGGKAAKRRAASAHATKPEATPADPPWATIANYPDTIMDNGAATDTVSGDVYSVGGFDGTQNVASAYVYDPATQAWTTLPDMQNSREAPQAAFIDGKLYVVGGWDNTGNPVGVLEIYDPGINTWSTGASIPNAYAGASVAVYNGDMYVIGGCDADNCGHDDVQIYDPASNSWSTGATYPTPIAWSSCGTLESDIYCAGGTTGDSADTSAAYAYSPATNSWASVAPLPIDLWASGYSAADGKLLVSGGVTNGFNTVTNQGYAYDPSSNSWTALPNSNNTDYRGGSGCGFYRVGGSTLGFSPGNFVEQLPGYATCGVTNVPWLSESRTSFTLQPGHSVTVTVTMNAASKSVTQPGTYTGSLSIGQNTPYQVNQVGVTMAANPPVTWGKITGKVTGLGCHAPATALAGATVQINTWATSYTLKTGSDGSYALWLDVRNNPLKMIVALDGWQPQARTAKIKKLQTTTENFALKNDNAC